MHALDLMDINRCQLQTGENSLRFYRLFCLTLMNKWLNNYIRLNNTRMHKQLIQEVP